MKIVISYVPLSYFWGRFQKQPYKTIDINTLVVLCFLYYNSKNDAFRISTFRSIQMNNTLKITSVLSDPTRYNIYQYINETLENVTVQEVATKFQIHPNVARLHLTKLEEVKLIVSKTQKTGKGGRPSKVYNLSNEVIQLHFPYRDYQLLAKIALETLLSFGAAGIKAFTEIGLKYGNEMIINTIMQKGLRVEEMTQAQKLALLEETCNSLGFYSSFEIGDENTIYFDVKNCPFRELSVKTELNICSMHTAFIHGMVATIFPDAKVLEMGHLVSCRSKACNFQIDL